MLEQDLLHLHAAGQVARDGAGARQQAAEVDDPSHARAPRVRREGARRQALTLGEAARDEAPVGPPSIEWIR